MAGQDEGDLRGSRNDDAINFEIASNDWMEKYFEKWELITHCLTSL